MRISRAVLDAVFDAAATGEGREVCGLLLGEGVSVQPERGEDSRKVERIVQAVPTANVAANLADSFEIDPAALFAAIRSERGGGPRLVGHYHSHPNGATAPSPRDAASANQPGRLWLIVAHGQAKLWCEQPGGPVQHAFVPVPLVVDAATGGCA